jgi:hypothetical protein
MFNFAILLVKHLVYQFSRMEGFHYLKFFYWLFEHDHFAGLLIMWWQTRIPFYLRKNIVIYSLINFKGIMMVKFFVLSRNRKNRRSCRFWKWLWYYYLIILHYVLYICKCTICEVIIYRNTKWWAQETTVIHNYYHMTLDCRI